MSQNKGQLVQCFGKKKNAVAVATVRAGKGVFRVNGSPVELLEPQALRVKVMQPVLLLGLQRFQNLDIRVRVRGSGYVAQIYAIRQAISKGVVAYYQKYVNESEKRQIKCKNCIIKKLCYNMIGPCQLPTQEDVSPKSTEAQALVQRSKSLIDERQLYQYYYYDCHLIEYDVMKFVLKITLRSQYCQLSFSSIIFSLLGALLSV